jgi:uncharacterized membrane protein
MQDIQTYIPENPKFLGYTVSQLLRAYYSWCIQSPIQFIIIIIIIIIIMSYHRPFLPGTSV